MKYKFNSKDHVHELAKDDTTYAPLYGTTTIINEVYPPPLSWYGSAKALESLGFISENKEPDPAKREELATKGQEECRLASDMNISDYMAWLDKNYRNHDAYKKSQGKKGVDMHAEIEKYINFCLDKNEGKPYPSTKKDHPIAPFIVWAFANVQRFLWTEAHTFSEKLWVGGICDWGAIMRNGKTFVGDNKSGIYPKYFLQTAGYGLQIKENGLYDSEGRMIYLASHGLKDAKERFVPSIDGYCIYDYNKGIAKYVGGQWVEKLESAFIHTVEMYKMKDLTGSTTLE